MAKTPKYARHVQSDTALFGFSSIAPEFWRAAELLRGQAEKETEGAPRRMQWRVPPAICLYHAALDCFINEEVTLAEPSAGIQPTQAARIIQDNTLNAEKLDDFYSHRGLELPSEVKRRTLLLCGLRNRLAQHWPLQGDIRDYPVVVIDALKDAKIEPIYISCAAQCSDVRLAKWAAEVTRAFVDEWWRQARRPGEHERRQWEFGEAERDPARRQLETLRELLVVISDSVDLPEHIAARIYAALRR